MRLFLAVARAGSLSSAARSLGVSVATVSRRIASLESHVGARLLSRSTRRMALTEAGARYREACERVEAEVEAADREASGARDELSGTLAVTAPVSFGRLYVVPVAAEFLARHPGVDVRLALADRVVDLIDDGIDVAVRIGALRDSSLVGVRVGSVRRVTCASPAYLRAYGTPRTPEELGSHACVVFEGLDSQERWIFKTKSRSFGVGLRPRLVVSTADAAIDAAVAGVGVTRVLTYQSAAAIAAGRLTSILERFEPPPLPVTVLHREGRSPRPKVRHFVSLLAQRLRETVGGAASS